jgi:translation initiation factor IF-2
MTETKEKDKRKKLSLSRPGKLELNKTVEGGQVRQNFSHGRSKVVAVEVRKKRTFAVDSGGEMAEVKIEDEVVAAPPPEAEVEVEEEEEEVRAPGPTLTTEEKAARVRALQDAQKAEEEAEIEAAERATDPTPDPEEEVAKDAGADASTQREEADEERRVEAEEETRREEQARTAAATAAAKLEAREREEKDWDKDEKARPKRGRTDPRRSLAPGRGTQTRRRGGKLTIDEALGVNEERTRSLAAVRRARERQKQQAAHPADAQPVVREVVIPETITVQELANRMAARATDVTRSLMKMDVMVAAGQEIDGDTAELVVTEFGHTAKRVSDADVEIGLRQEHADDESALVSRPPVVTIMGHVDHGKTSLLDALRETDVAAREAGGITQHIGAYQVTLSSGGKISFVDTPGHEAFTDMRARGAKVTDIVVLVVAADDGIMPQTVEAIAHARAAEVPIIVAINKMDRPNADAGRVRQELLQHELVVEEMGGEILAVEVSAMEKTNLDKLEEAILLQAEILDLKANPDRPAEGVIVEAKMERGRGTVATVLVQAGTLRPGDIFVAGAEWGRVRAMIDATGNDVAEAGPAMPVEVTGLNGTPAAGDEVAVVEDEGRAREVTEFRQRRDRETRAAARTRGTMEEMFALIQEGEAQELPVVIKGDVHGSVEAIVAALDNLSTDEVKVDVLHAGVGGINESDVTLARASGALVIGFNVRANPQGRELATRDNVEIRYYSIIYEITDDFRQLLTGMLAPAIRENFLGYAEVREVFNVSKVGKVAGCMVTEGQVRRGARVRLLRDDVVIHDGSLSQLKRFKDDVRDVQSGNECGMAFENYHDLKAGDRIECFEVEEVAREL